MELRITARRKTDGLRQQMLLGHPLVADTIDRVSLSRPRRWSRVSSKKTRSSHRSSASHPDKAAMDTAFLSIERTTNDT